MNDENALAPQNGSVDWIVEDCIAKYPGLFPSRTDVLHHLFVVLGCGYEWQDGRLVDKHMWDREAREDQISRSEARRIAQLKTVIDDPYPWCDLCNLATMPDDVEPDWRVAALEITEACPSLSQNNPSEGRRDET